MAVANFIQKRFISNAKLKWAYNLSGFNKYGLMRDDMLNEECDPDVKAALARLPQYLVDERNYRLLRATQLDIMKTVLPKDQWVQLEDDVMYLQPYIKEIVKERKEREEWEKHF